MSQLEAFHELSYYTIAQPRESFIHQHVVDAFAAQTAGPDDKSIKLVFALVGLCLAVDYGCNGKRVQDVHVHLAKRRTTWSKMALPQERGDFTVFDVLAQPPGESRNAAIDRWCLEVWRAWSSAHEQVHQIIQEHVPGSLRHGRAA